MELHQGTVHKQPDETGLQDLTRYPVHTRTLYVMPEFSGLIQRKTIIRGFIVTISMARPCETGRIPVH
jgi:hypothetical protein